MATLGFPIYISIILCLTVKIRGDFTIITAVSKLKDMVDKLKDSVDSINVRIDNLEKLSNTNNVGSTKKDNVMTETGDVEQTDKRVIKALISEKVFVRNSLSVYEGKFKDFQKQMTEQMNVINSKLEASHDTCERICAENVANLNSWNKSLENYQNRLEYAINNATIDRETRFIELQQTIDQVATNASTKIESVEMDIYESLPTRTEEIWASIGICPIPFDIDRRLSVKYEMSSSSHLDIREGNTIRNQDYAIFNCSNVIEQKYEPSNRRFQCVRGQWMEADISHDWKLGNNGAFPECREAICDHPCENGGVCFQDGLCRCEHMTTGERCQTLLCHKNCTKNGGECVKPGTCGNCPKSRHGENCELAKPCKLLRTDEKLQYRFNTHVDHNGNEYIVQHNAEVFVSCNSDYELYNNRTNTFEAEIETTITCRYGNMGEIPNCAEKRCKIDKKSNGECYQRQPSENKCISRNSFIVHSGRTIYLQCKNKYTLEPINAKANDLIGSMKCTKGKLSPQYRCNPDCTIPESSESSKYTYTDHEGNEIIPLQSVMNGKQISVECKYDSYIKEYYDVTPIENITCVNGILDSVSIICPDPPDPAVQFDPCQKFKLKNGAVTRNAIGEYYILCDQGYTLNLPKVAHEKPCNCSEGELVCFAGQKPVCKAETDFKYVVRILVSDKWNAGTGDNINVCIYGHDEHTATFRMNGLFGRNKLVETEFRGIDVRPIQRVVVGKDKGMIDDSLSILYASIFIEESDEYYVFTYRDQSVWLTASKPVELSISQHPERCIHTYGEAMNRSPKHGNRGRAIAFMPLRECKQRCATTRSLSCNSIHFMPSATDERGFGYCYHYTHSPASHYFMDNTAEYTHRQYVSYKRICREP